MIERHDLSSGQLAYAPSAELAGIIMPAEPPAFLTIFYVGVMPEMRGRGYVGDLLAAGTVTPVDARADSRNEKPLRADTDVSNAPMAAAFEQVGSARFAGRRESVVGLTSGRA